jgi:restriction system protein
VPDNHHIRPSGGYRELRSFQTATVIYDATVAFCERFVDRRSPIVDQMVQAARSGRQNIAEGSRAAATSSQSELRVVSVGRASLDELLLDYEDFLRQRSLAQWPKESPEAMRVREAGRRHEAGPAGTPNALNLYSGWLGSADSGIVANTVICLIHQANYLLDRQLAGLERKFIHEGGYSERLAAERVAQRQRQGTVAKDDRSDQSDRSDRTDGLHDAPGCPVCQKPMVLRTARKGQHAGAQFWGCSAYPDCKGVRGVDVKGAPGCKPLPQPLSEAQGVPVAEGLRSRCWLGRSAKRGAAVGLFHNPVGAPYTKTTR